MVGEGLSEQVTPTWAPAIGKELHVHRDMLSRGNSQYRGLQAGKGLACERPAYGPSSVREDEVLRRMRHLWVSYKKFGFYFMSHWKLLKGRSWWTDVLFLTSVCCMGEGPTSCRCCPGGDSGAQTQGGDLGRGMEALLMHWFPTLDWEQAS